MLFFLLMLWHNHCYMQMCLLIGTVSQVSDVTHGPLVLLFHLFANLYNKYV